MQSICTRKLSWLVNSCGPESFSSAIVPPTGPPDLSKIKQLMHGTLGSFQDPALAQWLASILTALCPMFLVVGCFDITAGWVEIMSKGPSVFYNMNETTIMSEISYDLYNTVLFFKDFDIRANMVSPGTPHPI